jgi:hypothetical protein
VDIWPLGCILHELVFGAKAFSNDFAASRYADSGKDFAVPPIPDDISDEEKREFIDGIIRELLSIEGTQRPSARSLYERWESYSPAIQATSTVTDGAPLASHLAPLDPVLPPVSISNAPNVWEQSRAGLQIPSASISAAEKEIDMDGNCVGWSLNSTGTLLVMTIYSELYVRIIIEVWDVAIMTRIWKMYALDVCSTTFSPNGKLLGIFILGSTLRFSDIVGISVPPSVEIINVRNSPLNQSQGGPIFMDAGTYQQTSTDRTLPDSFTITNTGLQMAVSICDRQDNGYHLQQTGVNNRPNSIHVLHSPSKCLLQYSEDGRRLYCVTTTEDSFASQLILRILDTEKGTVEAMCTCKLYGLPLTHYLGRCCKPKILQYLRGHIWCFWSAARKSVNLAMSTASSLSTKGI